MSAEHSRPRTVTAAFWCWEAASFLLLAGGLIAAAWPHAPAFFRGAGVLSIVAGAGMALFAGRSRNGDVRFRRAGIALSLAIVVLVCVSVAFGVGNLLTLLAVLPLIAGTVLMTRPSAAIEGEGK
jgi:hypothetical protein